MRANKRKFHYIYKTICLVTNRYYIGMHSTDNLEDGYSGSGTRLAHSKRKYGVDQHRLEILEFLPDRKSLRDREAKLVDREILADPMCMNLSLGGGDIRLTKEQYIARNLKCTAKLKEKLAGPNGPALRRLIGDKSKEKFKTGRGFNIGTVRGDWTGKKHRDDTIAKMRISAKGKHAGSKNSRFGACWIHNDRESKSIKKTELQPWLDQGWVLGRKMFGSIV